MEKWDRSGIACSSSSDSDGMLAHSAIFPHHLALHGCFSFQQPAVIWNRYRIISNYTFFHLHPLPYLSFLNVYLFKKKIINKNHYELINIFQSKHYIPQQILQVIIICWLWVIEMHWCNNANSSKIDRAAFFFYEVTKELLSVLHRSPQTKHSTNSLSITEGDCEDYSRSSNLKKEKKNRGNFKLWMFSPKNKRQ